MSTSSSSRTVSPTRPKFTRGEKCIFIHLIVTFCLILFLVVIYFIHLCVVNHSYRDVWKISRRRMTKYSDSPETDKYPVGHVYLKDQPWKLLCNTVLLHPQWSVGPAHCVAIRTDPDMADLLFSWRIRYANQNGKFIESKIKRTIPHPHFNRDDFRNNVGLFEHNKPIRIKYFEIGTIIKIDDNLLLQNSNDLALFGWMINSTRHEENRMELVRHDVQPVSTGSCVRFMAPILELRDYEYCVILSRRDGDINLDHGSVFLVGSSIMGFFAWGEKSGKGVPCIIIDLQNFKTWLENIIAW